jgi:hypothetical protein
MADCTLHARITAAALIQGARADIHLHRHCCQCPLTIKWSSKKQPVGALSSTESKYMGLIHAFKEILWI